MAKSKSKLSKVEIDLSLLAGLNPKDCLRARKLAVMAAAGANRKRFWKSGVEFVTAAAADRLFKKLGQEDDPLTAMADLIQMLIDLINQQKPTS